MTKHKYYDLESENDPQDDIPTLIVVPTAKAQRAFYRNAELDRPFTCDNKEGTFRKVNEYQSVDQLGHLVTFPKQEIITYV